MESIILRVRELAKKVVDNDNRIVSVSLLGSYFKGTNRENSDIDLALLVKPESDFSTLDKIDLCTELTIELDRTIDIGLISSKNLVYSREALLNGELLYTKDIDYFNLTRATLLGMYLDFNHNRKEILNEYRAR